MPPPYEILSECDEIYCECDECYVGSDSSSGDEWSPSDISDSDDSE